MDFLKKIHPNIYLLISIFLITTAIATLFLGKFMFAIISLIIGIISLIAWTFWAYSKKLKILRCFIKLRYKDMVGNKFS